MSFFVYLKRERYKLLTNAIATGIGLLAALLANSSVDEWKERRAFDSVLAAVRAEAKSNQVTLETSFIPLYERGIVIREFGVTTVGQALANPAFVKQASADQLNKLANYLRDIALANAYRTRIETIRFNEDYLDSTKVATLKNWEPGIVRSWRENLKKCKSSIASAADVK